MGAVWCSARSGFLVWNHFVGVPVKVVVEECVGGRCSDVRSGSGSDSDSGSDRGNVRVALRVSARTSIGGRTEGRGEKGRTRKGRGREENGSIPQPPPSSWLQNAVPDLSLVLSLRSPLLSLALASSVMCSACALFASRTSGEISPMMASQPITASASMTYRGHFPGR